MMLVLGKYWLTWSDLSKLTISCQGTEFVVRRIIGPVWTVTAK